VTAGALRRREQRRAHDTRQSAQPMQQHLGQVARADDSGGANDRDTVDDHRSAATLRREQQQLARSRQAQQAAERQ